MKIGWIVLNLN